MRSFFRSLVTWSVLFVLATPAASQVSQAGQFESMQGFGSVIAFGPQELVVGEPRNLFRSGMVYLYQQDEAGEWVETARLTAPQPALQDRFGSAIAIYGNTLLVSADSRREESTGIVFLFTRTEAGGREPAGQWAPDDGIVGDHFGASLVLGEDIALVGSPSHADTAGAVYVFTRHEGSWRQSGKLGSSDPKAGDRFGASIGSDGDHLMIGAPGRDEGKGAVFHFHRVASGWVEQGVLDPGRVDERSSFGTTVAVAGSRFYVDMPRFNNRVGAVAAFAFDQETGEWRSLTRLVPFDGRRRAGFGSAMAVTDDGSWLGLPAAVPSTRFLEMMMVGTAS